jgi:type IX secretion system PorP/SprF family membrane protein
MVKRKVLFYYSVKGVSMKKFLTWLFFLLGVTHGYGQYFQFSQYNFTGQRINPATVGSSNYAEVDMIYRNQSTDGGIHLSSNFLNGAYPLISRSGVRWAGVGLTLMDDRAGQSGIFTTQELGVSFAVNIPVARLQTLSIGFRGVHARRKVDMDGLYTGLQYLPDRGFDEGVANGENYGLLTRSFNTFSSGIYWQKQDKKGHTLASVGVSFFDFNRPDESMISIDQQYPSAIVTSVRARLYTRDNISMYSELLLTINSGSTFFNTGLVTSYEIRTYKKKPSDRVELITKYKNNQGGLLGVQLHKEAFSFGFSYDFPLLTKTVANTGSLEVAVALKKLVEPKRKIKRNKRELVKRNSKSPLRNDPPKITSDQRQDSTKIQKPPEESPVEKTDLSTRLRNKQDSLLASGVPGAIVHEPLVLEKATLHFNFSFGSTNLDSKAQDYLEDVAQALIDNPDLKIELEGHTDNIGSPKFNLRLSQTRAEAIKDLLIEKGVDENRIKTSGKGMTEPLNDNSTEELRSNNRRVEMRILYEE